MHDMSDITKIRQLSFSDLYLGHPSLDDRFSDVPGMEINPMPANAMLQSDLDRLKAVCRDTQKSMPPMTDFKVCYDGVAYRASVMATMSGDVFVLRKIASTISSLADLGIPQAYIRCLMSRDMSGLFVVSGAIKSGKTMTACALTKERLTAYGGVAVTAEDPIELPLEGCYGAGVCYQTAITRQDGGFVAAFRRLVRWGAKIILIGEIHDPDMAAEVLQASVNGHLVISTMHAESVIQTITKLHTLADEKLAPGSAQSLLADGLAGVLHQQLTREPKKNFETEFLFLKEAKLAKTILRNGKYDQLTSEIRQQMACLISANATALRHAGG
jgi:Tfp pilus assembly pilus retraction ATPase PilT